MHRRPLLFTAAATGILATLTFAGATMAASTTAPLNERTDERAAEARSFMDEFAAQALRSRSASEFSFRHFSDLFIRDDDRVAGGALGGPVTAAVFGGGEHPGKGFAFGGANGNGKKGTPPGFANGFPGQGKGLGQALGPGPGAGQGPGGGGGITGSGGGGGNGPPVDFGELAGGDGVGGDGCHGFGDKFHGGDDVGGDGGSPDASGAHAAAIPLPPALWLGIVGLAAVGVARRRALGPRR